MTERLTDPPRPCQASRRWLFAGLVECVSLDRKSKLFRIFNNNSGVCLLGELSPEVALQIVGIIEQLGLRSMGKWMGWLTGLHYGFVDLGVVPPATNGCFLATRPPSTSYGLFNPTIMFKYCVPTLHLSHTRDNKYLFLMGLACLILQLWCLFLR